MASANKFNCFVEDVMEKKHNLGSDTLKLMLSNTAPAASNTVKADITEIAAGNGYSAGGTALSVISSTQASGTYSLKANDVVFTASGGAMATFRYVVLYNDTATNDELICWWDNGSAVTLADTETFTVAFTGSNIANLVASLA